MGKPRKDWITNSIVVSCGKKQQLYTILISNNPQKKRNYNKYTKCLKKIIKDANMVIC